MTQSYKLTKISAYLGIFVQAIISCITPILFIPMMELYGLTYTQLGILVAVNFVSQVLVDVLFSGAIDKLGYKKLTLPAIGCALVGFILFALSPTLFSNVYTGMLLATVVFSAACGLLEVMLSPMINAIPSNDKAGSMSLLHSFFAWGEVVAIILTTLFVFIFGGENWQIIVLAWAIVPAVCLICFAKSKFPPTIAAHEREKRGNLLLSPFYLVALLAIFFGAATELIMSQWSSAYLERAVQLPKLAGDLLGTCGFAVMMGVGRTFYGIRGERLNMGNALLLCSVLAAVCYLTAAVSPFHSLSLLACAFCGLGSSLLWPGTLVCCTRRFPLGGAWMFAILAAAGDIGGAFGPWLNGILVDIAKDGEIGAFFAGVFQTGAEQGAMRFGMLISLAFPLGACLCHYLLRRMWKKHRELLRKEKTNV